jgi:hypothetical protein
MLVPMQRQETRVIFVVAQTAKDRALPGSNSGWCSQQLLLHRMLLAIQARFGGLNGDLCVR